MVTNRASNCSERFLTNCGQCAAPGISDFSSAIIWQPLQTPSAKRVGAREEALEIVAHPRVEQITVLAQPPPPPRTSP